MQLEEVRGLIELYTYFILFPLVVIEGPIVTIIAGFLTSVGILNFFVTYAIIVAGDVGGDTLWYGLGRFARGFVERLGHLIGFNEDKLKGLNDHFGKNSRRTIFFGKLLYGAEIPVLVAAGIAKVKFREFLIYTLVPTLPKSLFFLVVGYYFGGAYETLNRYLNNAYVSGLIILVCGLFFYLIFYKFIIKRIKKGAN